MPESRANGDRLSLHPSRQRSVEQALRESDTRFRQVADASNDWIWEVDEEARYTYVSRLCREVLGYGPEELVGTSSFDRVAPGDRPRVRDAFGLPATRRDPFRGLQYESRHKDGRVVVLESNGAPIIDAQGTVRGHRGVTRDITEQKRLEDQLRQAQKMAAIGTLAGGIAHDFNNHLTAVLGYADLILRRLQPTDPLVDDIGEIRDAANQAALLARQLVAFSRKEKVVPRVLDVSRLVVRLESTLRLILGEDVALKIRGTGSTVEADPSQLEQVILTLAIIARDAMAHGGDLTIDSADTTVPAGASTEIPPGSYVTLTVSGGGSGAGAGLSTVREAVKPFGGYISVSSEIDRGTALRMWLPRVEEPGAPSQADLPQGRVRSGSETVLVVEDEAPVRRLMRATWEGAGYTVLEAQDGAAALALYEQKRDTVRLVITDIVMPRLDGGAVGEWLSSVDSSAKVLFVSGYTEDLLERKGIHLAGAAFLSKPFTAEALLLHVREVLDEGRSADGGVDRSTPDRDGRVKPIGPQAR